MVTRRQLVLVLVGIYASMGAAYRTTNFAVEAPNAQVAKAVGDWAEYYRKQKAEQWLGHEMPAWSEPCPLHVKVTMGPAGGATSFNFMHGQVWQTMQIEGSLDRILASVLPHEVTHTVFAHHFRQPVPRWADEGGAVLSEDNLERGRHDQMVRQILNANRAIPLRTLFSLRDYPHEVGSLYAEGYSVADFLVGISDRPTFLNFVARGMQYGWDNASQSFYRYQNVNALEQAWLDHLIQTKKQQASAQVAQNSAAPGGTSGSHILVRLTAPPVQPFAEPTPVVRAQAPDNDPMGGFAATPAAAATHRPGYLPEPNYQASPSTITPTATVPQSPAAGTLQRPAVRLGIPQVEPAPLGRATPGSPVGYPN
jgi:hypothetical protein